MGQAQATPTDRRTIKGRFCLIAKVANATPMAKLAIAAKNPVLLIRTP